MHFRRGFRAWLTLAATALATTLAGAASAAAFWHPSLPPTLLAASNGKPRMVEGVADTGQFLPDDAIVARFDTTVFTVRDYVAAYFSSFAGDRPSRDSLGRVAFLKALISKELLGRAARKVGYNLGYEGRVQMREYSQRVLANALFTRAVLDSAVVTEADILHVYDQFKRSPHVRRIVFADRATAERVRLDLVGGRIGWKDAVTKYSRSGDHGVDGEFGWVVRSGLDPSLAEAVYSLKPGGISSVVEVASGPQVLQCTEIRSVPPPALESVRYTIKNQLRNSRVQLAATALQNILRHAVEFVPDTANLRWASKFFVRPHGINSDEGSTTIEFDASVPVFAREDTSRVLARWKNGQISLGEFVGAYSAIPPLVRPAANTAEDLELQVANVALEPYKALAAIDRGYDKDPAVVQAIDSRFERLLVERMYDDSVSAYVQIQKSERHREYDAHPEIYRFTEERQFAAIGRRSQAGADSVVAELRAGRRAEDILAADSAAGISSGSIRTMREDEHGPMHRMVFEEMKAGGITTFSDRTGAASAVQLISVRPARRQTYEEAEVLIDESLRDRKAEALLDAWIKRLSRGHIIVTHPELVMKIALVDPFN